MHFNIRRNIDNNTHAHAHTTYHRKRRNVKVMIRQQARQQLCAHKGSALEEPPHVQLPRFGTKPAREAAGPHLSRHVVIQPARGRACQTSARQVYTCVCVCVCVHVCACGKTVDKVHQVHHERKRHHVSGNATERGRYEPSLRPSSPYWLLPHVTILASIVSAMVCA